MQHSVWYDWGPRLNVNNIFPSIIMSVFNCFPTIGFTYIHIRSEEMSTPRYLAEDTDSGMQLWRVYCVRIGGLDLVMWMTLAFRGVQFHVSLQNFNQHKNGKQTKIYKIS